MSYILSVYGTSKHASRFKEPVSEKEYPEITATLLSAPGVKMIIAVKDEPGRLQSEVEKHLDSLNPEVLR